MSTDFATRETALRDRLDAPKPTTWRPDDPSSGHGALLIGELVAVENGRTDWGARQIAILKDAEGALWNVWLLHHVLIGEFLAKQPAIGEMLAVRYEGKQAPKSGGKPYEKYTLAVDREAGGTVAWASPLGATPNSPPAEPPAPPPPPAAEVAADECGTCGYRGGKHASGCTSDIPF